MIDQHNSEQNTDPTDNQLPPPSFKKPDIRLLDDRQWLLIQRRYRLSPRELQVAKHVCQGFVNEEIAGSLRISIGTVKTHLRNIYRRIHVTNKIGMLLRFLELFVASESRPDAQPGLTNIIQRGQPGSAISS